MDLRERHVRPLIEEALTDTPVVSLQGARQTGKSTLAQIVAQGRDAVMVTLDDAALRSSAKADPAAFVTSAGDRLMVIDEVQRVPELILAVKATVDHQRRPGRFLLTGSADLLRVPGAEDSLAGRAETITLAPLSQGEISGQFDDMITALLAPGDVSELSGWSTGVDRGDVVRALCAGGLPEAAGRDHRRRRAWIVDYVDRLMRRDAHEVTRAAPHRLRTSLELLAANQAGELVIAHLARAIGVSEPTAAGYVDTLQTLYLVARVPAWSRSLVNRRINKPKTLVVDSAVAAALSSLGEAELLAPLGLNHLGGLLEGFVAAELLRQRAWSKTDFDLSHYRESGGVEVDLIATLPGGRALGLEVKATTQPTVRHFSGLSRLRDRLGADFAGGVVLHLGTKALAFGPGMLALPVPGLWGLH